MAKISGHMTYGGSPARMEEKMGKSKYDPLTPDLTTLCKLGSIVVHVEEMPYLPARIVSILQKAQGVPMTRAEKGKVGG